MRKIRLLIALLVFATLLCSCVSEKDNSDSSGLTSDNGNLISGNSESLTSDNPESLTTNTDAPEPVSVITLFAGGKSGYTVVRPDEAGAAEVSLVSEFYTLLVEKSGCKDISILIDFISSITPNLPDGKELLVGLTNRDESTALNDKLTAAEGNRFGIYAAGTKVAVLGSTEYLTYLGLDYLFSLIKTGDDGLPALVLEDGFEYISEPQGEISYTVDDIKSLSNPTFTMFEKIIRIPSVGDFATLQGGGTDGKYAYYAMKSSKTGLNDPTPEPARIYKYDLETWECVKVSEVVYTGHSNDITYNSKKNQLVISFCMALDGYRGITYMNPDTLEVIDYVILPMSNRGLDYLPETDRYVVANNFTLVITDGEFNEISHFQCSDPQYITQGLCSDGKYVYDVRYVSGSKTHFIIVHDLDGNYIGSLPLTGISGEPENIFRLGDDYYVGCNGSDSVYLCRIVPDKWWS